MFLHFFKKPTISCYYGKQRLLHQINESKLALDIAYSNFENMTDPALIDCSIYELKAAQRRYAYLLDCAKEYDMSCLNNQILS